MLPAHEQQSLRTQLIKIKDKLLTLSQELNRFEQPTETAHFYKEDDVQSTQESEEKSFEKVTPNIQRKDQHCFKKTKPLFKVPGKSIIHEPMQRVVRQVFSVKRTARPLMRIIRYSPQSEKRLILINYSLL